MVINVIRLVSESFISLLVRNEWKEQQSREPVPVVSVFQSRVIEDTPCKLQSLKELMFDFGVVN